LKLAISALLAATLAGSLVASSAIAQPPKAPPFVAEKDPTKILGGAYVVEPEHTRVMFAVSHKGFTTYYGQFSKASGTLNLDTKNPAASTFDITVPVATVSTTNSVLDGELREKPWMDATTYPTITFKSVSVKPTGPNTADVTGAFTFHGVTKPLTLKVKFNGAGMDPQEKKYTAGFDVSGQLKRSEYGMPVAVPLIGDDITLIISGAFVKAP